jgi:dTDP-4-dehydrorhamnose reductase
VKFAILGASGQIGWELNRVLAAQGDIVALARPAFDLGRPDELRSLLRELRPDVVVNAAAYTAVDKAEAEPAASRVANGDAPAAMAQEAARLGAWFVHYSTDYVFDGAKHTPYVEDDPTAPINAYGRSKLLGEQGVQAAGGAHLILRTSWVYGLRGANFLRTMLRLAHEREELRVVADQHGTPNWCRLLAEATGAVLAQVTRLGRGEREALSGIYHLSAAGEATWHGFASSIFALDHQREQHLVRKVEAIATSEFPTPARRPANSRLDTGKLTRTFGLRPLHWHEALELVMRERAEQLGA